MEKKYSISKIIWIIMTISLTIALIQGAGHLLDPFEAEDGLDAVRAFHSLDNNTIDVIVYGSSRAWKGFDPSVMRDEYGISAYNYGCNWQAINTTLLFIQDSLRTQSPEVIFVETGHVGTVLQDTDLTGEIYYTRHIPDFEGKRDYLKQCFGDKVERYASYYFPLIMFHDNWTEIDFENFYAPGPSRYTTTYGYNEDCNDLIEMGKVSKTSEMEQYDLSSKSLEVLDKIVKTCKESDIRVVFFTNPCFRGYNYAKAMDEYANSRNVEYLNIYDHMDEIGMNENEDFQDAIHLNKSGAKKTAKFLSEYLKNALDY